MATTTLVVTGCGLSRSGDTVTDSPTINAGEFHAASELPCPEELPLGDDPSGHGFGVEAGRTATGGTFFEWVLAKKPAAVDPGGLAALQIALDNLSLPDQALACTDDLGPRWMVAYVHEGDLTGAVVDDYGCRDVRLTDNPHTTSPGAGAQDGTVAGVLDGGQAILDALDLGRQAHYGASS